MASLLPDETAADRLFRIQAWRDKAVSQGLGQDTGIPTQLCVECIDFYLRCLRQLSQKDCLPKPSLVRLTRNWEALVLWAYGYDILEGGLNEVLMSSRRTRRCYLQSWTSLCTTLLSRLLPLFPSLCMADEAMTLKKTLDASILCLEDTYHDGDSIDSAISFKPTDDTIEEVIEDLEVDLDNLIALDSLISCPADRRREEAQPMIAMAWAPHQVICERVANMFPQAEDNLVQRIGKATWDSFLRCKRLREGGGEEDEAVEADICIPPETVATSLRSKDSGLGSSLPTVSYAETIMSYRRRDGESVKVPPLPTGAVEDKPFNCFVCGKTVMIKTNGLWKKHLFADLRPYICVFESSCPFTGPFGSRKDWVSHTIDHIWQLEAELDAQKSFPDCPLCLENLRPGNLSIQRVITHLGAHLEEIALGAIILHADVESDANSTRTSPLSDTADIKDADSVDEKLICEKCGQAGHIRRDCGGDMKREPRDTAFPEDEILFGDLGEDLFEKSGLTDADFNFFNQEVAENGLDLSGLPGITEPPDLSTRLDHAGTGIPRNPKEASTDSKPKAPTSPVLTKPELERASMDKLGCGLCGGTSHLTFHCPGAVDIGPQQDGAVWKKWYGETPGTLFSQPPAIPPSEKFSEGARYNMGSFDHEQKYCICRNVKYGEMIACSNVDCAYKLFHPSCIGFRNATEEAWHCPECTANGSGNLDKGNLFAGLSSPSSDAQEAGTSIPADSSWLTDARQISPTITKLYGQHLQIADWTSQLPTKHADYNSDAETIVLPGKDGRLPVRKSVVKGNDARLSGTEVGILEAEFVKNSKPSSDVKRGLAELMVIDVSRINNWFQNRRAKEKVAKRLVEARAKEKSEPPEGRANIMSDGVY